MITFLVYFANFLTALFVFALCLAVISLCVMLLPCIGQYMACDEKELQFAKDMGKKTRRKWLPWLVASMLWLALVPDGSTFLKMKAAQTVGDERVIELLEVLDNKLIEELEGTIDYD